MGRTQSTAQKVSINIDPNCTDDFIQAELWKCIFILRHRQNTSKLNYLNPVANDAKWEVFWKTVSRYSLSIAHNQDDEFYDFQTNYSLIHNDEHLDDWKNKKNCSRSDWKVSIGTSKWLLLHCCLLNSTVSDEYSKVLSYACIKSTESKNEYSYQDSEIKETPLHLAVNTENPNIKFIQNLLKYFRQMSSAETPSGQIPLHYAINSSDNVEIIEMLIKAYPEGLEKKCKLGEVPLFKACVNLSKNSLQIVQKLLQASPYSVKSINNAGETAFHVAITLLEYSPNPSLLLDIIQILLIAYPECVMLSTIDRNTLLHQLCSSKYFIQSSVIFKLILDLFPAAVSTVNNKQQTPLHVLLRDSNGRGQDLNSLVSLLLDMYPRAVTVMDTYGCYPIHYAVMNDLNLIHIQRIGDDYPDALLAMGRPQLYYYTLMTPLLLSVIGYEFIPSAISCDRLTLVKYLCSRCPESIHVRSGSNDTVL